MITLSSINMRVDFFFFLNIFFYHIFIWIKQKIDIKKIQENVTLRGMRDHDDSFATGGPPAWWHRIPRSRQCFLARIWWIRWFITSSFHLIFLLFFFSFSFCISLIVFTSAGSINTWASGPLPPSLLPSHLNTGGNRYANEAMAPNALKFFLPPRPVVK